MELECVVQKYKWGKIGSDSEVARLAQSEPKFNLVANETYAEFWMGTHPNGPSKVRRSGQKLEDFIAENPDVLGIDCRKMFGDKLPFLFKVLSVNQALSIQAHPDKKRAEELNAINPEMYKDPNHKPEMAIALTDFEALCAFRPLESIHSNLKRIPQLRDVVGLNAAEELLAASMESNYFVPLRKCFTNLMDCDKIIIGQKLKELEADIRGREVGCDMDDNSVLDGLFLRLVNTYPGDVGCFVIYLLNFVTLSPGEALFLEPNVPHAYLLGDCVECMACSDNVVRAGLTPKPIDAKTLCEMLEYKCRYPQDVKFTPERESENSILFEAPVPDFSVVKLMTSNKGENWMKFPARKSASIAVCVRGKGTYKVEGGHGGVGDLKRGTVLFIPATLELNVLPNNDENIICYQAFC